MSYCECHNSHYEVWRLCIGGGRGWGDISFIWFPFINQKRTLTFSTTIFKMSFSTYLSMSTFCNKWKFFWDLCGVQIFLFNLRQLGIYSHIPRFPTLALMKPDTRTTARAHAPPFSRFNLPAIWAICVMTPHFYLSLSLTTIIGAARWFSFSSYYTSFLRNHKI